MLLVGWQEGQLAPEI